MNKVNKALGLLRHKTAQAQALVKSTRGVHKRVYKINDVLNATVAEQNERLETLASNCRHYRTRLAESEDRINLVEEKNNEIYQQLKSANRARSELLESHREQSGKISSLTYRNRDLQAQLSAERKAHKADRIVMVGACLMILGYQAYVQGWANALLH
jgi:chromosome segregation ATPase